MEPTTGWGERTQGNRSRCTSTSALLPWLARRASTATALGLATILLIMTSKDAVAQEYMAVERGPHHTVWQRVGDDLISAEAGSPTNSYVELASGLNILDAEGKWVPASEEIESAPGGAIARKGAIRVSFANSAATRGCIQTQYRTAGGEWKSSSSHVLGLSYFDYSTGQSVLIAEVLDRPGEILPPCRRWGALVPHAKQLSQPHRRSSQPAHGTGQPARSLSALISYEKP